MLANEVLSHPGYSSLLNEFNLNRKSRPLCATPLSVNCVDGVETGQMMKYMQCIQVKTKYSGHTTNHVMAAC